MESAGDLANELFYLINTNNPLRSTNYKIGTLPDSKKRKGLAYNNGDKWFLELLVQHLSAHINARQPAPISRVAVIPANHIFQSPNLSKRGR